jgi:hypothetical protein
LRASNSCEQKQISIALSKSPPCRKNIRKCFLRAPVHLEALKGETTSFSSSMSYIPSDTTAPLLHACLFPQSIVLMRALSPLCSKPCKDNHACFTHLYMIVLETGTPFLLLFPSYPIMQPRLLT